MADKTKIEWADATWNPIRAWNKATGGVGHFCAHVSEGCRNCYAERIQPRFQNPIRYAAQDLDKVELFLDERVLEQPMRWRKPRKIFPCSMTDMFADFVPDDWLHRIFNRIWRTEGHTFQILTKRHDRMRSYFTEACLPFPWPLPNVHLYVSCEDQETAVARIPVLLATPAAVRGVSLEPLLGPISLRWLNAWPENAPTTAMNPTGNTNHLDGLRRLDHVIVGGESGPRARPMHPDWARTIRDQCQEAAVPFFFKQMTKKAPIPDDLMIRGLPLP